MLPKDFITKDYPVLKSFDTGKYALSVMNELKAKYLPLVVDKMYQGILSEKDILEMPDFSTAIGKPVLFAPNVTEDTHIHEILARMAHFHLCLLPVISNNGQYIGVITCEKMIDLLAEFSNAEAAGSVIVLELLPQDYVLSDIVRIVEANNARVINLLYNQDKDTGRLIITIKIDLEDALPVIRSFERFNYNVLYHYMEVGMVEEILQRRMDELLYYVNM